MSGKRNSSESAAFYEAAYTRTLIGEPTDSIIAMHLLKQMGGITFASHSDYVPNTFSNTEPEEISLETLDYTDSEIAIARVEVEDQGLVWQAYELLGRFQREMNTTDRTVIEGRINNIIDELKSKYDQLMEDGKSDLLPGYRKVMAAITNILDEAKSQPDENSLTW